MKRILYPLTGAIICAGILALNALAQSDIVARFTPFLIDVTQAVPIDVTVTLPNADGEPITTTVPLTVSVNLQVRVESPYSVTVITPTTPTVDITPIESAATLTDDLGLPYQLLSIDTGLRIIEWTAYRDSNNNLNFAGELRNISIDKRFSLAEIVVRLYRADGTILEIEDLSAGGRWVEPDETIRFDGWNNANITQIAHYTIKIIGQDWQPLP